MKNSYSLNVRAWLPLVFLFAFSVLFAQQRNLKTEVLVYIMPDSLELPVGVESGVAVQSAIVKSRALKKALQDQRVTEIIRAFPDWPQKDTTAIRNDGVEVKMPPFHRIFTLTFAAESEANTAVEILQKLPAVLFAEKHAEPVFDNDPFYINGVQWYLNNDGRNGGIAGADINAEGAWAIFTGSPNTKIAIIDSGVDINHDDLTGKVSGEIPFSNSHGTRVAGIAAAHAFNGEGIRGVDWNAQIISKRIENSNGQYLGDPAVADKIVAAVNEGAHILNCSWSFPSSSNTLAMAFAYAFKMNRVSVATMGNTGTQQVRFPGAFTNVMAVGATQNNDERSGFSTTGNHIDVAAPGGSDIGFAEIDIFSTTIGDNYGFAAGTSFAAPQVTGLASLLKGFNSNLSNDDIRQIIRLSANDVNVEIFPGFDQQLGFGRINAGRALNFLVAPSILNQWSASGGSTFGSSTNYTAQFISASGLNGWYAVQRSEVRKAVSFPQSFCQITGVWGRGVSTNGWSLATPNFGEGFCGIVPGTLTGTGATLRTYVYKVYTILGQFVGWYPTTASNVTFHYSVLGIPNPNAGVSGPNVVCDNGQYSFQTLPQGTTGISWSSNNPTGFPINSSGLATRTGGFSGGVSIVGRYLGGVCNGITMTKPVWVGLPSGRISGPGIVYPQQVYTYNGTTSDGTYEFGWSVSGGGSIFAGGTPNSWVTVWWDTDGSVDLQSTNPCGTTYSSLNVTVSMEGGCNPCQRSTANKPQESTTNIPEEDIKELIVAYPNPSSGIFMIKLRKDIDINNYFTVVIFDTNGREIKSIVTDKREFEIDLNSYPRGLYLIKTDIPNKYFNLKLQKN